MIQCFYRMNLLFLGRKHIAKCEDIVAALQHTGISVDACLFPNFHYAEDDSGYVILQSKTGTEWETLPASPGRSRAGYYASHFFTLLFLLATRFRKNDYGILFAVDWFEAAILLCFRSMFARDARVVFYGYDYYFFTKKFSSRFLINRIDAWAARRADHVWVVNERIAREREKAGVFSRDVRIVPLGIRDKGVRFDLQDSRHFLFVGNLKKGHNLLSLIEIFDRLAASDSRFRLTVAGKGNMEDDMRREIQARRLENVVFMRGFLSERAILEEIRKGSFVAGLALYEDTEEIRSVDPGKIKDYLSWNMPVITTPFNPIAEEIRRRNIGYVTPGGDLSDIANLLRSIRIEDMREKQRNIALFVAEHSFEAAIKRNLPA